MSPSGKIYIGQTSNYDRRMKQHKYGKDKRSKIYHAIIKYGFDNFNKEIIDSYVGEYADDALNVLETYWITHCDSVNNGYNTCSSGQSCRGIKHSDESRANMAKSQLGKIMSEESKKKLSALYKGKSREVVQSDCYPR